MAKHEFALIGDSHAGTIGRAARERGIEFGGGPIASGKEFYSEFFEVEQGKLSFVVEDTIRVYGELCQLWGVDCIEDVEIPIVSTIGSGFHFPAARAVWANFRDENLGFPQDFIAGPMCQSIFQRMQAPMLAFHQHLVEQGKTVFFALPPQRIPDSAWGELFRALQNRAVSELTKIGCSVIDVRNDTSDKEGNLLAEYCQDNDPIHGNTALGKKMLEVAGL
ncbi:hypothetical protein ATL17_0264 [Maritalea mobilis]|uniref:GDSL-like lipase/acylhydrolase family protein n=1 Tax=Maritalea mobilis TaxID=483324 RepID=A0A4R6VQH9_9HYPH|nr:hypothetical protein [Maritalea mobilis]TDQ66273.1 hypothetical protein ATL17_0264 [Maritalea mobilis]